MEATQASPARSQPDKRERQCLEAAATPPAILVNDEALSPDKLSPCHALPPVRIEEDEEEDMTEKHSRYVHFTRLKQKGPVLNGKVCVYVSCIFYSCTVFACIVQFVNELNKSPKVFKEGRKLMFRVTIIQATGIPREYADVFVQYRLVSLSRSLVQILYTFIVQV